MTSLPHARGFTYGSASSAYSVRDAIESYRRSQYLSVNANVASQSDTTSSYGSDDDDEEAFVGEYDEDALDDEEDEGRTPGPRIVSNFDWDVDEGGPSSPPRASRGYSHEGPGDLLPAAAQPAVGSPGVTSILVPPGTSPTNTRPISISYGSNPAQETTPLLHKAVSFSRDSQQPLHHDRPAPVPTGLTKRRLSTASAKSRQSDKYQHVGKSTFGQTLFNSIAVLLGIGLLSEPLAFAYAGWIGGTILIIGYSWMCCYTAKILGGMVVADPSLRSYADIGRKAFGPRSIPLISTMFCLELFAVSVALVTLSADSLHSIFPAHDPNTYKVWGLIVLIPTVFMPLSLLSYTSILGITSTLFIVLILLIDGFSKREGPGSLWSPAETSFSYTNLGELGISFGLFMAGLSGHAIIPSLTRDMIDPTQYEKMIDWAFAVATVLYAIIGACGYLMFGHNVHDEVSIDLLNTTGYNVTLNKIALWTFVISPLSKFALATRPVNITLEIMLGLEDKAPPTAPDDHAAKPRTLTLHGHPDEGAAAARRLNLRRLGVVIERCAFTLLSVAVSVLVPGFSAMMAFIGSFSAFLLCVIGPISAKIAVNRKCGWLDGILLLGGIGMAAWGTGAAFWAASG